MAYCNAKVAISLLQVYLYSVCTYIHCMQSIIVLLTCIYTCIQEMHILNTYLVYIAMYNMYGFLCILCTVLCTYVHIRTYIYSVSIHILYIFLCSV